MTEFIIAFILGWSTAFIALLSGYSLGKHQALVPTDVKKQINQIFHKVVPNPEVGAVQRPTVEQNFYRDNPKIAEEYKIMQDEFDNINKIVS